MKYCCCTPRRLQAVTEGGVWNGIAFLEVSDTDAPTQELRQRTLMVHLLKPPGALDGHQARGAAVRAGGLRLGRRHRVGVRPAAAALAAHQARDHELGLRVDDRSGLAELSGCLGELPEGGDVHGVGIGHRS